TPPLHDARPISFPGIVESEDIAAKQQSDPSGDVKGEPAISPRRRRGQWRLLRPVDPIPGPRVVAAPLTSEEQDDMPNRVVRERGPSTRRRAVDWQHLLPVGSIPQPGVVAKVPCVSATEEHHHA